MKLLLVIVFIILSFSLLFTVQLPISVDLNRFLDDSNNTVFDINYQLTYNFLHFEKTDAGFVANLKVEYSLLMDEKIIDKGDFSNKIIFPNQEMTKSGKLFRDKISVTLPSSGYTMQLSFYDTSSDLYSSWSKDLNILKRDSFLSDLEFSSNIVTDTTDYLDKFHRDDQLFFINCNHIYSKETIDSLYLYFEVGNGHYPVGKLYEKINIIKDDDTVKVITQELNCHGNKLPQIRKIDISNLEEGYHKINLEIIDPVSNAVNKTEDYFSIKKESVSNYRLFVELEDEIILMKYFLSSAKTKIWKNLTDDGKLQFIDRFWEINDSDVSTKRNEFYELIRERIKYCNNHYSHFGKGWKTDQGRIYIKYGEPDDILYDYTDLSTKYAQKKYEIWKFRTHYNYTYLFLDFQTNGNYKLIYSDNDPNESSSTNLEKYLGEDFDMDLLN